MNGILPSGESRSASSPLAPTPVAPVRSSANGDALFEQRQLDLVVVVRDRESAQHEHRLVSSKGCAESKRAGSRAPRRQSPRAARFRRQALPARRAAAAPGRAAAAGGLHQRRVRHPASRPRHLPGAGARPGREPRRRPEQRPLGARPRQGARPAAQHRSAIAPACSPRSRASSLVTLFDEATPLELLKIVRARAVREGRRLRRRDARRDGAGAQLGRRGARAALRRRLLDDRAGARASAAERASSDRPDRQRRAMRVSRPRPRPHPRLRPACGCRAARARAAPERRSRARPRCAGAAPCGDAFLQQVREQRLVAEVRLGRPAEPAHAVADR